MIRGFDYLNRNSVDSTGCLVCGSALELIRLNLVQQIGLGAWVGGRMLDLDSPSPFLTLYGDLLELPQAFAFAFINTVSTL